jgi:hypothetical protein
VLTYRQVALAAGGELTFGDIVTATVTTTLKHLAAVEPIKVERWGNFPYIAVSWLAVQEKDGKISVLLEELRYLTDQWTGAGSLKVEPVPPPKKLPIPATTPAPAKKVSPTPR